MAKVSKDFKIKYGLIVEGSTATVNGYDVLTKKQDDQDYIVDLIGGETLVKSVNSDQLAVDNNGQLSVNEGVFDAYGSAQDAYNNANSYTDGEITTALSTAQGYANTAQGNAEDYADTVAGTAESNAKSYADGLASNYDPAGTGAAEAGYVQDNLDDHTSATSAHGTTGNVVGTTDTQTLTNKTIGDTLNFTGAGAMTINSDSHIVLTPAAGSSVKWGADVLATQSYADGVAGTVAGDLTTHINDTSAHGVTGDVVGTTDSQTISNKTLGSDLAAAGYKVSGLADPTADQEAATKKYVDDEITALVDGAPGILDTLNELAVALGNDKDMATGLATAIGNKVLKAGDSMSGNLDFGGTNKVTGLATPSNTTDAANKDYVDGEISTLDTAAQGYATTAQTNAEDYADGLAVNYGAAGTAAGLAGNYDAAGSAATAETNANNYTDNAINELDTDSVEEGVTNQYFTDARAKSSAADLLTGASLTNITITGTGAGLTITAENGVADSDTDDLTEGITNLYFTDNRAKDAAGYLLENSIQSNIDISYNESTRQLTVTAEDGFAGHDTDDLDEGSTNLYFTNTRAQDAVDGTTRSFTSINLDTYRTEEATQQYVSAASTVTAHTFTGNKSAKYLVRTVGMDSGVLHSQISEVLVTVDGANNVAVTEYGTIHTSTNPLSTVTADYAGGEYRLRVTTAIVNAEVIVAATTMSWAD